MPLDASILKVVDRLPAMLAAVERLTSADVLVGVPAPKAPRRAGIVTNAMLAAIHENGSPAQNIPARPFIRPGIMKIRARAVAMMRQGAKDAVLGKPVDPRVILERVGMLARNAVVEAITDPEPPFVPIGQATIRARLRRTAAGRRILRSAKQRSEAYNATHTRSSLPVSSALTTLTAGMEFKPLIDTGQLRASIGYIVR